MAIANAKAVSEETYRKLALADSNGQLELHNGQLREKPGMSFEHGDIMFHLGLMLGSQLNRNEFRPRAGHARLRRSARNYYVPDLAVIPTALERALREQPGSLDAYAEPLPLVVEIWSLSTGDYDVDEKLGEYQRRGDLEIWRIHPNERTVTIWRKQPDGSYAESIHHGGTVHPASLPNVAIDLDALFAE